MASVVLGTGLNTAGTGPRREKSGFSESPGGRLHVSWRMVTTENFEKCANLRPRSRAPETTAGGAEWTCARVGAEVPAVGGPAAGTVDASEEKPPNVGTDSTF